MKDLMAGNFKHTTTDSFVYTTRDTVANTTAGLNNKIRRLEELEYIIDPELFEFYEKKIMNKLLHCIRLKLAGKSDVEIYNEIEAIRKRFTQFFKVKRLDWMITSLSDRDKLRAYTNLHVQPKS